MEQTQTQTQYDRSINKLTVPWLEVSNRVGQQGSTGLAWLLRVLLGCFKTNEQDVCCGENLRMSTAREA
ncbi:hypothetical protein V6N13_105079 [Hibiscus sabdariffa]|uniref:Uncharacterized protein n=1 Tax=Hibiscus sabdariffa TaxID=183260 RepID=A0ABR2AIG5_9ROSI